MTKGWCPVHDRIVESRSGTCPECGTPLVDLAARPHDATESRLVVEAEPEPAEVPAAELPPATETALWPEIRLPQRFFGRGTISIGPAAIAAILSAAVVASFLVGLAIPRGRDGEAIAEASPKARGRHADPAVRHGAGLGLQLEGFSQDGFHVTVRVTVPEAGEIEIGRIQSIEMTALLDGSEHGSETSLEARPTVSTDGVPGFVAEGNLPIAPSTKVTGIRIETLRFSSKTGLDMPLDLTRVTPTLSGTPRVNVSQSGHGAAAFRNYVVENVVGWPDRLEVRLHATSERDESWLADEVFSLVQTNSEPVDGVSFGDVPPTVHVVFLSAPPWSRRATLRVTIREVSVGGHWEWEFA